MNSTKAILKMNNTSAKKSMGQHFLKVDHICKNIVDQLVIKNSDIVLEVGPGLGALTIPMSKLAKKIFAVEKDYNLVKILRTKLLAHNILNIKLINADILKVNFDDIYNVDKQPLVLVGNLPYNVSSQILIKVAQNKNMFVKAIFMLQKEVADRICSKPGSKNYGRLSVLLQYSAKLRNLFTVKPSVFFPKPKIESSLVEIDFSNKLNFVVKDEKLFLSIVRAAFSKRRKMLKNSLLESHLGINLRMCEAIFSSSKIDPTRRAETLSIDEFVLLSNCFYERQESWLRDKDSNLD